MTKKINSRAKGKSAEREVINLLTSLLPELNLERNLDQTREGGYDIKGMQGWAPEVKRYRTIKPADLASFWDQTIEQARNDHKKPLLIMREDFRDWVVVLRLTDVVDNIAEEHDDSLDMTCQLTINGFIKIWKLHHWE